MNYFTKDKPYNSLNEYYKKKYNAKIAKIALNGGFTCPNKDGKKGVGGCSYCSKKGSGDFAGNVKKSIKDQFLEVKALFDNKWPNALYMPYFQANTNTYAPLSILKKLYSEALSVIPEKTVGLAIATRPDCLPNDVVDYLGQLSETIDIQLELGLQTINETTAKLINRCSTNEEFIDAVTRLSKYPNISIVVHIINGLPFETSEDMLKTIEFINKLPIQGIKIHSLLVLKNTAMEDQYKELSFPIMTLEEYVDITVQEIKRLRPDIIIHRLAADGVKDDLITPKWSQRKLVVMNEIDKKMRKEKAYQGQEYKD